MCIRWQGQPLTKISGYLDLPTPRCKGIVLSDHEVSVVNTQAYCIGPRDTVSPEFLLNSIKDFFGFGCIATSCDTHVIEVVCHTFWLVHIKQFYRHWIHFLDISVTGSINSKTKCVIFAVFNYVSMAVGSHSLIDNCSCICCTAYDIVYTTLTDNNRADTVLELFIKGIQEFGLPSRVRSDHGLENVGVAQYMLENRGLNRGSIMTGSFVHNCRIERAYNEMFTLVSFVTLPISWVEWKTWVFLTC